MQDVSTTSSQATTAAMVKNHDNASLQKDEATAVFVSSKSNEKPSFPGQDEPPSAAPGVRNMSNLSWILVLTSILSAVFLFALDNTVVADIQPKIINLFGEIEKLPWVSVAFALGAVAVNLLWYDSSCTWSIIPARF